MAKRGKGVGIRVGVKTTGCSGLAYVLEFVDEERMGDKVVPFAEDLAVYIDPKAFEYLKGSTLDYVKRGLNEGFEFINPNEKGRCGCGESFTI
ncbi:MAG: iron-sulfur cluster assembly protein IscA [Gammaproteobacteria bacterium RIFCSPHIGHO2_12_FULL_35_23]|nr:MAG: iron-sulfur cluster assembly protein IscA [Gammaproteobacteria bacterium RIFCSPHIGHO2_12_FULL_35_23]